jgi:hypothetical protein
MKTKKEILEAVEKIANKYNAKTHWSIEDGITWLTLYGGDINPKKYDKITSALSKATKTDCYFNKCGIDYIEIAVDAIISYIHNDAIPETHKKDHIKEYGTLIK